MSEAKHKVRRDNDNDETKVIFEIPLPLNRHYIT